MIVTFQNVTLIVELPEGVTDPRVAYVIVCNALGAVPGVDWETDTYDTDAGAIGRGTEELFPRAPYHGVGHATWEGTCLDCGVLVPSPSAECTARDSTGRQCYLSPGHGSMHIARASFGEVAWSEVEIPARP